MKFVKLFLVVALFSTFTMFAQGQQQQEQKAPDLDISFKAGDIAIFYQNLATVDIKGEEAQQYVDVQNFLKPQIEDMVKNTTKTDQVVKLKVNAVLANSMFVFANRMTIKGGEASNILGFKNSILDAAKALKTAK